MPMNQQARWVPKELPTSHIGALCKEKIMLHLHQKFEAQSMLFNASPDYAGLLSNKFSSFVEENNAC